MPVTVHEVLLRILTELDPTAIDQAVKQLEELIKRGETLHGALEKVSVATGVYDEATLKALGGIQAYTGGITKLAVVQEAAKIHKEVSAKVSAAYEERVRTLTERIEELESRQRRVARVTRLYSDEVKALQTLLANIGKTQLPRVYDLMRRLTLAGAEWNEVLRITNDVFSKGITVIDGHVYTLSELNKVLPDTVIHLDEASEEALEAQEKLRRLDEIWAKATETVAGFNIALRLIPTALGVVGAAYIAFARESVRALEEWGLTVYRISLMSGIAAEEASKFASVMEYLGITTGLLTRPFAMILTQIRLVQKDLDAATKVYDVHGEVVGLTSKKLAMYGIALTDVHGRARPMVEILADISDLYLELGAGTDAAAMATAVFGFQYRTLLPLLELGGERIRELYGEIGYYGYMTEESMRQTVEFHRAKRELGLAVKAVRMEIGEEYLPVLTDLYKITTGLVRKFLDLSESQKDLAVDITSFTAIVGLLIAGKYGAAAAGAKLGGVISALAAKIGLSGIALSGFVAGLGVFIAKASAVALAVLAVIGVIELLELVIGRQILPWTEWIDKLREWIGVAEEVREVMEYEPPVVWPVVPEIPPPAPPFPWEPILEAWSTDLIDVWAEALPLFRQTVELELVRIGYTQEEAAARVREVWVETATAIARDTERIAAGLAAQVTTILGVNVQQVWEVVGLMIEAIEARTAVEDAKRQVDQLRDQLRDLREAFREEVEVRREQVDIARERVAAARSAVDAIRAELARLKARQAEEIRPLEEAVAAAAERVEVARAGLDAARSALEALKLQQREEEEAQRERIEIAEDRVELAREEVERQQELLDELHRRIDEEVEERLRLLGIIIDPARLEALKDAVADARAHVEDAKAALEEARARRKRYGLMLLSWEEINAQAALEMAESAERRAEASLREYERQERIAKEIRREVEKEYEAERELIEDRLENAKRRVEELREALEAEREALEELRRVHREERKPLEERVRAARERLKSEEATLKEARRALRKMREAHRKEREELQERLRLAEAYLASQRILVREAERAYRAWRRARERQFEEAKKRLENELAVEEAILRGKQAYLDFIKRELRKRRKILELRLSTERELTGAFESQMQWTRTLSRAMEADAARWMARVKVHKEGISATWRDYERETGEHKSLLERVGDAIKRFIDQIGAKMWETQNFWWGYHGLLSGHGTVLAGVMVVLDRLFSELGTFVQTIQTKWEDFKSWLADFKDTVVDSIGAILEWTRRQYREWLDAISDHFESFKDWMKDLKDAVRDKLKPVIDFIKKIVDWIKDIFETVFGRRSPSLAELVASASSPATTVSRSPNPLVFHHRGPRPAVALTTPVNVVVNVREVTVPLRIDTEIKTPKLTHYATFL